MATTKKPGTARSDDAGLCEIDELERLIIRARVERLEMNGVPPDEAARERVAAEALAAAVCRRLREDYLRRQPRREET